MYTSLEATDQKGVTKLTYKSPSVPDVQIPLHWVTHFVILPFKAIHNFNLKSSSTFRFIHKYTKSRHLLSYRLRFHLCEEHWFCTRDGACTSVCFRSIRRCSTCRSAGPFVFLSCKGLRMLEHPSKDTDTPGYYHCLASYLFFLFIKSIAKKAPICYQKPTWTRQS